MIKPRKHNRRWRRRMAFYERTGVFDRTAEAGSTRRKISLIMDMMLWTLWNMKRGVY